MSFEKIKYSKCPNCKKHGIPAFSKLSRVYNPDVQCCYCKKIYSVNIALSKLVGISIAFLVGIIGNIFNKYVTPIPFFVWVLPIIFLYLLFEYYAPLEEAKVKGQNTDETCEDIDQK